MAADLADPVTATSDDGDERVYPPFWIKRLQIRNFKSIEFADFTLEPLTVFVGRNGAGKSNVLDAVGFLGSILSTDLATAIRQYGGVESIRCRGGSAKLRFEVDMASGADSRPTWTLEIDLDGTPKISFESLKGGGTDVWDYEVPAILNLIKKSSAQLTNTLREALSQRAYLKWFRSGETARLADALADASVYRFDTASIRAFTRPTGSLALMPNGANVAQSLNLLRLHDSWGYDRLQSRLAAVVPKLISAEATLYNDSLIDLLFRFDASEPDLRLFPAPNVSDGTLRALATLVCAFQIRPRIAEIQGNDQAPPRPAIVAIEEPETSLHPAALDALIFSLDAATSHTQVILSTHNADWLGIPPVGVDRIRVVQMVDGRSVVGPVDGASREILHRGIDSLADMQRQAHLEPDPDDLARQAALRVAQ